MKQASLEVGAHERAGPETWLLALAQMSYTLIEEKLNDHLYRP